jgi:rod shape determining protein RodA
VFLSEALQTFFKKGDMLLLSLCLLASGFGLALIYSATRWSAELQGNPTKQLVFIALGVVAYIVFTLIDIELILEKSWIFLLIISIILLALLIPFGVEDDTGNRNWMYLPGIPFGIQPAEIVKLFFVMLLARILYRNREYGISRVFPVLKMAIFTGFFMGLNTALSKDFGMSLVYLFIFVIMAFVAGVRLGWFILAGVGGGAAILVLWKYLPNHIQMRFRILFDHNLDPQGVGWHQTRSLMAIGSGRVTGMGYLNGRLTQSTSSSSLPARHTDFIFSVCGEEFGMVGCLALLALLLLIILRCVQTSRKARSHLSAYIALGFAGMLMIQIAINVGMCLYVAPVVGLTLPFFSYGGSSILTLFAAMGVVSGIKMRSLPSWLKDRSSL